MAHNPHCCDTREGGGNTADYNPLESSELTNGHIESKTSILEKKVGNVNSASARVTAGISQAWALDAFPKNLLLGPA